MEDNDICYISVSLGDVGQLKNESAINIAEVFKGKVLTFT